MPLIPAVVRGQVTPVGADLGRTVPDPEPAQTRDRLVVREPAQAQLPRARLALPRAVRGGGVDHVVTQRRVEGAGPGPAGVRGPLLAGFQVGQGQAGDDFVAQLQGAPLVELAQPAEKLRRLLQRLQALETPAYQAAVAPRLGVPQMRDG